MLFRNKKEAAIKAQGLSGTMPSTEQFVDRRIPHKMEHVMVSLLSKLLLKINQIRRK